uniref:glucose-6-phosphatase n=1 Tax=Neogobius melanostomus TaxID=47308 RepID=A0A8C6UDQ1_9GOBI
MDLLHRLFNLASSVADLHTTFFLFFPIWFHLRKDTALRLIWVAVIGDWLNLVLKWVLFGERPYWWVHETRFYGNDPVPALKQFPITCETGPGSKVYSRLHNLCLSFGFVTCSDLHYKVLQGTSINTSLCVRFLQMGLCAVMGLVLLIVCMSRVYMAAHFPHQVIAGILTGILVAEVVSQLKSIYSASLNYYILTTVFLTSFAVGFYLLLKAMGVDLLWTMERAQKWCVHPEWVHLDTAPFASLLRNMGTLAGLGLGLHSPLYTDTKKRGYAFRIGCITIALVLLYVLDGWTFSPDNHMTFYSLSFGKSTLAILISTTLVPWALYKVFAIQKEDKKS